MLRIGAYVGFGSAELGCWADLDGGGGSPLPPGPLQVHGSFPLMRLVLLAALIAVQATCSGSCNTNQGGAPSHHLVFTGPAAGTLSQANADCRNYVDATQLNVLLT